MKKSNIALFFLLAAGLVFFWNQNALAQAGGTKPELVMYRYNSGSNASPLPVVQGDLLGTLIWRGLVDYGDIRPGATIQSFITNPVISGSALQANMVFRTSDAAGLHDRVTITQNGLVGIGIGNPAFHLHTVGNTHTTGNFWGRIHFDDNQNTNDAPNTYTDEAYFELKQRSVLAVPGMGTHGGLLSLAPGATSNDHQLFFGDAGIWHRRWNNNAADWTGAVWHKLLTGEDINGTPNRIAKFTGPNSIGDSRLWDDGANIGINTDSPNPAYLLTINGSTYTQGNKMVDGNFSTTGSASAAQDVTAGTDINAGSNGYIGNVLTVGSHANVGGNANVTGDLGVAASAYVFGDAQVDGRVIVGNPPSTPGSYAMYVNGSIIATEVKVALQANWPDYVFEPGYALPNLVEWEQFISENKHLPGVPSAAEVGQNGGIELGEMNRILLQKVEELTLLLISQQKQIDALKGTR